MSCENNVDISPTETLKDNAIKILVNIYGF